MAAAPAAPVTPRSLTPGRLRSTLQLTLRGKDLKVVSLREVRQETATALGFQVDALDLRKDEINDMLTELVSAITAGRSALEELLAEKENHDSKQLVYLITICRVLTATLQDGRAYADLDNLEHKAIAEAVLDAFDNPLSTGTAGGRPRKKGRHESLVLMIVVYRELHADGAVHFHVVVKLAAQSRFRNIKRTLQERHRLPSHWSCSHSLLWSALRYGFIPTPAKQTVDATPWVHTPTFSGFAKDSKEVDLFTLSQRPYQADEWRKRREREDMEASKEGKKATFDKLDVNSLIISKHLYSKDGLLSYVQDYGTRIMQSWASKHQDKLLLYIDHAKEWATAKVNAEFEKIKDWDLLLQARQKPCPHGDQCSYKLAVEEIFRLNPGVGKCRLAHSLRMILQHGPSKHVRVPLLKGPSNSGKSTLLYPFDDLFGPKYVMHKPALGSSFALRNIAGKKRLIFWDDYNPIEFAEEKTVTKSTFLSLFIGQLSEIQVSQSFNDGNIDVCWNRGVVFTAKADGLWNPTKHISEEDVQHIRNRCEEFTFQHVFERGGLKEVAPCTHHLAEWIEDGAGDYDAVCLIGGGAAAPRWPAVQGNGVEVELVKGFKLLIETAQIPEQASNALLSDLEDIGAVDINELEQTDWDSLSSWASLRPLQQRRLKQHIQASRG